MKIIRATTVPQSLDTFCRGVLKKLSEKYEVVALSSPGEEMQAIAEREGVRTIEVPMQRHISLLKDAQALWQLIKVFRQERPTMVHSMTPKAGLLCMVAIAEAGTDGAEDGVVVVSYLSAEEGAVVEDFLQFVCLLACGKAKQHVVVTPYSLLCL